MSLAFQWVDLVVVLIIIASTAYAAVRGFISETLSIFAWAAAAFATLWFGPWIAHLLRPMIEPHWLGILTGYASVFLAVVIPLSFISFRFSEGVKKSPVSPLDHALGGAFGVARGLAIIGIAYAVFTAFVDIDRQPDWLLNARTLPIIQGAAQVVTSLVPDGHMDNAATKKPERRVETTHKESQTADRPPHKKHGKKTYGAKDRKALDKLIEDGGK